MSAPAESRPAVSAELDPDLAELIDRLTVRIQSGEAFDLEVCLREYPQYAGQLRELLPAALALMEVGRSAGGSFAALAARPRSPDLQRLGEYVLLREIGRGGMGVVYEAVQESLGRHVALKVLPSQAAARPDMLERFQREAKAAARLHHTNIVPVFGVGAHDGVHFYAMQYIHGRGLDTVLRERRDRRSRLVPAPGKEAGGPTPAPGASTSPEITAPTPPSDVPADTSAPGARLTQIASAERVPYWRDVARLGVQAAEALAYAHRHGILHRDIKPSNLLLDDAGTLWIADFGLARIEGMDDLTGTGDIVGTLRYLAPERFGGRGDARSDIYSLGLTLYELVAERPAYDEPDRLRLIERISQGAPPPRPRRIVRSIPRDLETIILKAGDREPSRRYQSAEELADDLRRFLADQPIRARRVGVAERCLKQMRRHPLIAGLAAALLIASLTALGIFVWYYVQLDQTNNDLEAKTQAEATVAAALRQEGDRLRAAVYQSKLSENEALLLTRTSGWRQLVLDNLKAMAAIDTPQRDLVLLRRQASDSLTGMDVVPLPPKLEPVNLQQLTFSPDGRTLYVVARMQIQAYDARTWEPRPAPEMFAGDVVPPAKGTIKEIAYDGLWCHPRGHYTVASTIRGLFFFPGTVDAPPSAGLRKVAGQHLAFDRAGDRLAVKNIIGGVLTIYDANGKALHTLPEEKFTDRVEAFALHPNGEEFVAATEKAGLRYYFVGKDRVANKPIKTMDPLLSAKLGGATGLQFSPDGQLLAAVTGSAVVLWQRQSAWAFQPFGQRPVQQLRGHLQGVTALAFSPDSQYLATGSVDRTVCLWDPWSGRLLVRWDAECGNVKALAFHPDGQTLAVGGHLAVRPFALHSASGGKHLALPALRGGSIPLAFHPKEPWLAFVTYDTTPAEAGTTVRTQVRVLDRASLELLHQWDLKGGADFGHAAFSFTPEGDLAANVSSDFHKDIVGLSLWDPATGKRRVPITAQSPIALAFSPDGKYLAWASQAVQKYPDKPFAEGQENIWRVTLWDRVRKAEVWNFITDRQYDALAFCPVTSQVVLGKGKGKSGLVEFHDLQTGKEIRRADLPVDQRYFISNNASRVFALAGRCLAFPTSVHQVALWEFPSLRPLAAIDMEARNGPLTALAITERGRYLATHQQDNVVTVWDAQTRQPLVTFAQNERMAQMAFSPDEQYLAVVNSNSRLRLYDLHAIRAELQQLGIK